MTEHRASADDYNKARPYLPADTRPFALGWRGITNRLWLSFGILALVVAIGGVATFWNLARIERDLVQVIEVEEPLEQALLEMEVYAGEAARAVLGYVRDLDAARLETIRDSRVDFGRFAGQFERLAETSEERRLGQQVRDLFAGFTALSAEIVLLADRRAADLDAVGRAADKADGALFHGLRPRIDAATPEGIVKISIVFNMARALEDATSSLASYAAKPEASLGRKFENASADLIELIEQYRATPLSAAESGLLTQVEEGTNAFFRVGRNVLTGTVILSDAVRRLEQTLAEMDAILDEQIQPLILAETVIAADDARSSINTAVLVIIVMTLVVLTAGAGSAWALSRGIVRPVRAISRGAEIVGDGMLTHRIDIANDDEFGYLAAAFNRMVERLQAALQSLEGQSVQLEHELLSRGRVEMALRESETNLVARVDDLEKAKLELQNQRASLVQLTKDLRAARDQAETADRAKSEFLAAMSHELRTPLNAVVGFSEIIQEETFGPVGSHKYLEYTNDIHSAGLHLLDLINDLLDLAKIESGSSDLNENEIEVRGIVHSARTLVGNRAEQEGIELVLDLPERIPALYADERKLKQILVNLLSNAIKFTDAGGRVTVSVQCAPDIGHIFRITDTGIGINPEDIPKALSRFVQVDGDLSRKFEGTGLGLPLTKSLIELHGGTMDLQSEVGVGTTVTVCFPAERVAARKATGA